MSKSRQADVNEAIKMLKEFHDVGRKSRAKRVGRADHKKGEDGMSEIEKEARDEGINTDTLRKARHFADPERGYSRAELKVLCDLIRKVQASQHSSQPIFGKTHMIRALSVPQEERMGLIQEALQNAWSTAELETEIAKRFGTRREGGRDRKIPKTLEGRLIQLENMCEQWRRWTKQVRSNPASTKRGDEKSALPPDLLQSVARIGRSMERLQLAVADELKKQQTGRVARPLRGD